MNFIVRWLGIHNRKSNVIFRRKVMPLEKIKEKMISGKDVKIVAFGDSLTQGWMVRKGYVDFVKEMLDVRYPKAKISMINKGIPGDTAEGGMDRLHVDVLEEDPDLVFIQFGLNDAYCGITSEKFKHTISSIVRRISLDTHSEILLITSVPILSIPNEDRLAHEFYNRLMEVAANENIAIALVHEYWKKKVAEGLDFRPLYQFDNVHPTMEGYRLMAEAVMEFF
jgi:lysophospholipase L1-like esterase